MIYTDLSSYHRFVQTEMGNHGANFFGMDKAYQTVEETTAGLVHGVSPPVRYRLIPGGHRDQGDARWKVDHMGWVRLPLVEVLSVAVHRMHRDHRLRSGSERQSVRRLISLEDYCLFLFNVTSCITSSRPHCPWTTSVYCSEIATRTCSESILRQQSGERSPHNSSLLPRGVSSSTLLNMNPHSNKLLDMLKSTASQSAPAPAPALSAPEGSPREPSPLPPPPSLQAVSLQDLFANISPPTSPPNQESHRSSLLGMLQSIGTSSETPSPGKDQPISDVSTQYGSIAPPEKPFQPCVDEVITLTLSSNEPVINHPQSPPAESTQPPHPTKSMFDFVSPFDVFDKAKKPQPKASPSPAPVKSSPKVTAPAQAAPPPRDPSPLPTPQSGQEARQRKPSSSSHQASKGLPQTLQPPQLPHLLSSVVPKGTTGNG